MIFKRLFMPTLALSLLLGSNHVSYGQTVTCSLSAPLGSTTKATATGHTEPIAAGTNAVPPTAGGGTVRVTCINNGASFTAAVGTLTISLGTPITNTTSHPSTSAGIRVSTGTAAFDTNNGGNVGISSVNNSAGTIVIGLGTPAAAPATGITFQGSSINSFDLNGVLVSMIGKSSVSASLSVSGANYAAAGGSVVVISTVSAGLVDPSVPSFGLPAAVPPGSTGGPAVLTSGGVTNKGNFTIKIQENYAAMFREYSQFNGGGVFPQSAASDVLLYVFFYNIPFGLEISGCSTIITNTSGAVTGGLPAVSTTSVSAFNPLLAIYFNDVLDLNNVDVIWLTCTNVSKGSAALPLYGPDIMAQVTLAPIGAALSNSGAPLTNLILGQTPRYQLQFQPTIPLTVVSILVPTITGISPSSALSGDVLSVEMFGTHLASVSQVTFSGSGITAEINDQFDFGLTMTVTIESSAIPGPRTVTATSSEGSSAPFSSFTVIGAIKKRSGQLISQ